MLTAVKNLSASILKSKYYQEHPTTICPNIIPYPAALFVFNTSNMQNNVNGPGIIALDTLQKNP